MLNFFAFIKVQFQKQSDSSLQKKLKKKKKKKSSVICILEYTVLDADTIVLKSPPSALSPI